MVTTANLIAVLECLREAAVVITYTPHASCWIGTLG